MARGHDLPALILVARVQPAEDRAAHACGRARGHDALGCTTDPDQSMDLGIRLQGHQGTGDVTVDEELDPGAGRPDAVG